MFGIVDGTNKRGRPCREWMDDIVSWCKTGLQEMNSLAQDRRRWKLITRQAMDTNRRWSHGSWRRRGRGRCVGQGDQWRLWLRARVCVSVLQKEYGLSYQHQTWYT